MTKDYSPTIARSAGMQHRTDDDYYSPLILAAIALATAGFAIYGLITLLRQVF